MRRFPFYAQRACQTASGRRAEKRFWDTAALLSYVCPGTLLRVISEKGVLRPACAAVCGKYVQNEYVTCPRIPRYHAAAAAFPPGYPSQAVDNDAKNDASSVPLTPSLQRLEGQEQALELPPVASGDERRFDRNPRVCTRFPRTLSAHQQPHAAAYDPQSGAHKRSYRRETSAALCPQTANRGAVSKPASQAPLPAGKRLAPAQSVPPRYSDGRRHIGTDGTRNPDERVSHRRRFAVQ